MLYINDGNGKVHSEYNRNGYLKYNYIYPPVSGQAHGQRLAKEDASGNVDYYHNDYLCLARAVEAV